MGTRLKPKHRSCNSNTPRCRRRRCRRGTIFMLAVLTSIIHLTRTCLLSLCTFRVPRSCLLRVKYAIHLQCWTGIQVYSYVKSLSSNDDQHNFIKQSILLIRVYLSSKRCTAVFMIHPDFLFHYASMTK